MTTNPRSQTHLAELLGVSKAQVSRNAARGMPTDTLAAAQAWRRAHLNIAQRKRSPIPDRETPVQRATRLMERAASALDSGHSIDAMTPELRTAMAAVPPPLRDSLGIALPVWYVLVAHVLDGLPPKERNPIFEDGTPLYFNGETMSDEEAQLVGEDWYRIACGEIQIPGCSYE